MQCVNGSASRTSWTDQLYGPAGQTSWTDQLDGPAGQTSSFYLKPWPVCIFEDWPSSLYIVADSESGEGLVSYDTLYLYAKYLLLLIFYNLFLQRNVILNKHCYNQILLEKTRTSSTYNIDGSRFMDPIISILCCYGCIKMLSRVSRIACYEETCLG